MRVYVYKCVTDSALSFPILSFMCALTVSYCISYIKAMLWPSTGFTKKPKYSNCSESMLGWWCACVRAQAVETWYNVFTPCWSMREMQSFLQQWCVCSICQHFINCSKFTSTERNNEWAVLPFWNQQCQKSSGSVTKDILVLTHSDLSSQRPHNLLKLDFFTYGTWNTILSPQNCQHTDNL